MAKPNFFELNIGLLKWGGIVLLSLAINFTIELAFKLQYRNYQFINLTDFLSTFIIIGVIVLLIGRLNKRLDKVISWEQNSIRRFFIQTFSNILLAVFVYSGFRLFTFIIINITPASENNGYTTINNILTILSIVSVYILIYVMVDLSFYLLNRWRISLVAIEAYKKESAEFKFNMLRSQINPHFLFNSLNTLSALIFSNQEMASQYTRKLSSVYRNILENRDSDAITLNEELVSLSNYIDLVKIRFQNSLVFNIDISEKTKTSFLPPLTLQLLVENAIKHNVVSSKKPLTISISSDENCLEVKNNLQPKPPEESSTEVGLKNIKNRFSYLTEKPVEVEANNNFFTVKLPLVYEA